MHTFAILVQAAPKYTDTHTLDGNAAYPTLPRPVINLLKTTDCTLTADAEEQLFILQHCM